MASPSGRTDGIVEAVGGHECTSPSVFVSGAAGRTSAALVSGVGNSAGVWSRNEGPSAGVTQSFAPYETAASGGYRASRSNGGGGGLEQERGETSLIILGDEQEHKQLRRWRQLELEQGLGSEHAQRLGMGPGMPSLDADALRHALSFLKSHNLARFARASTAARDLVSGHAALVIAERYAERYAGLRVGVRKLRVQASPRRLTFGAATGADRSGGRDVDGGARSRSSGGGGGGGVASSAAVPHLPDNTASPPTSVSNNNANTINISNNNHNSHGRAWDPEFDARLPNGNGSGRAAAAQPAGGEGGGREHSRPMRRERYRGVSGSDAELAKYGECNGNMHLALPALFHLECSGDLLARQLKTLPR